MNETHSEITRLKYKPLLQFMLVFAVLGLLVSAQFTVFISFVEENAPLQKAFIGTWVTWCVWLLFYPAIERFCVCFPNQQYSVGMRVLYLFLVTFVLVPGKIVTDAFLLWLFDLQFYTQQMPASFWKTIVYSFVSPKLMMETLVFWTLFAYVNVRSFKKQLQEKQLRESHLQAELVKAQLGALQMQLQPHFLFNTLNSVSSLLRMNGNAEAFQSNVKAADRMINDLSQMFRHTLKLRDVQMIPLDEELRYLQHYLDIESIRFSDRLSVELDVDETLKPVYVPAFILQPLVENAIKHGLSTVTGQGYIRIHIHQLDSHFAISIIDNGQCSETSLQTVQQKGVGISNLLMRLEHLYGSQYSFDIYKNNQRETQVDLRFPIKLPNQTSGNNHEHFTSIGG